MPAQKQRLRLLLSRLVLGGVNDDPVVGLLAGSVATNIASTTNGSTSQVDATITGLTTCHRVVGALVGTAGSFGLSSVCPGTNAASIVFANFANGTAASFAGTLYYIAFKRP